MAMLDLLIRNGTLVRSGGRLAADIGISAGRLATIAPAGTLREPAAEVVDATGLHILPGVIDGHVHFREPGLEHEETWLTGTRAAVFGGVTSVLDMPNTVPPTDAVEHARAKISLAHASAYCDFGILGLVADAQATRALAASGLVVGLKAFLGPTTGGHGRPTDDAIRIGLQSGLRVAFHAEDAAVVGEATAGTSGNDAAAHLRSRPAQAELSAIDYLARLVAAAGGAGHVLHVSSTQGLAAIEARRRDGTDLTAEVTPHHALLDLDVYARFGGIAKVNPPIRGGEHRANLLAALADGRIDVLGSDHAPHLLSDKQRASIWEVAAGFAGVETLLPLLLTEVAAGRLTLERLVAVSSERPAQLWGLWPGKGALEVGADADLVLVDLQRAGEIRAAGLHGLNNHSPFEGRRTMGAAVTTIVRGQIVVRDGELVGEPGWGRVVNRS